MVDIKEVGACVTRILERAQKRGLEVLECDSTRARFVPFGATVFVTVEYADLWQGAVVWSYGRAGDVRETSGHQRFYARPEDFLDDVASAAEGKFPIVQMSLLKDGENVAEAGLE